MKELTLKIPDQVEGRRIKEMIAYFLFKNRPSKEEDDQFLESMPAYMASVRPVRPHVTLEEMKAEQDYHPINKADFFAKAKEINIEEPLEELLKMLD